MDYPQEVMTVSKKGKREVRSVVSHGKYVMYEYLDPSTGKRSENKMKLVLKTPDGFEEYFIIPLKEKGKFLMLKGEEKGDRGLWMHGKAVRLEELLK